MTVFVIVHWSLILHSGFFLLHLSFIAVPATAIWTKPDDLQIDKNDPLGGLIGQHQDRFHAALCDGSVRGITKDIDPKILHQLLTRDGGEVVGGY